MANGPLPLIIVSGNCTARFLFRCLRRSDLVRGRYDVMFVRNLSHKEQDVVEDADLARCAVMLSQIGHKTSDLFPPEKLATGAQTLRFPVIWMNSLWPTHANDPRNLSSEEYPRGPYPYGDSVILEGLDQGLSPKDAARKYLDTDIAKLVDLDRFHAINAAKAAALDRDSDFKWGRLILDGFVRERLFLTYNHPTTPLLRTMVDEVATAIGFPDAKLGFPKVTRDGIGAVQVPIHPRVAEHFKLQWYDPSATYRWYDHDLTAEQYFTRYAAFSTGLPIARG